MTTVKVNVKWGAETFRDVDLIVDEAPLVFSAQLFALTGVEPDRQKLLIKGKSVKSTDANWDLVAKFLKNGSTILLMGTQPEKSFAHSDAQLDADSSSAARATAEVSDERELVLPGGMQNLGNTCYLNSTCQFLKAVPELRQALAAFPKDKQKAQSVDLDAGTRSLTVAYADLVTNLDTKLNWPFVVVMVQTLHSVFPQFATRSESGKGFEQQDANECWVQMVDALKRHLRVDPVDITSKSVIDLYFGIKFDVETKCTESDEEPAVKASETSLQLSCFIDKDVAYLNSGLLSRLTETVTKHSTVLERDAVFTKSQRISRLPAYLTVQMVRFQYKQREGGPGINAKILKNVKFPVHLDTFDLCSPELQAKLIPARDKFKEYEDYMAANKPSSQASEVNKMGGMIRRQECAPSHLPDDFGSNNSGYYELVAVLTHKGRSSDSGHYVAWLRLDHALQNTPSKDVLPSPDVWVECNDENVTPVHVQDVLKLAGGGDWHTAYLLLYAARKLPTNYAVKPSDSANAEEVDQKK